MMTCSRMKLLELRFARDELVTGRAGASPDA
jgi:hypothetical protein